MTSINQSQVDVEGGVSFLLVIRVIIDTPITKDALTRKCNMLTNVLCDMGDFKSEDSDWGWSSVVESSCCLAYTKTWNTSSVLEKKNRHGLM